MLFGTTVKWLPCTKTVSAVLRYACCPLKTGSGRCQDYQDPRVCMSAHTQPALFTHKANFGLLLRSAVPVAVAKKQPFLVKEDAMKAAAGVFFQTHSGPTDACKKLSLGDPQKATPHIIYYLHKIKASAE